MLSPLHDVTIVHRIDFTQINCLWKLTLFLVIITASILEFCFACVTGNFIVFIHLLAVAIIQHRYPWNLQKEIVLCQSKLYEKSQSICNKNESKLFLI